MNLTKTRFKQYCSYIGGKNHISLLNFGQDAFVKALTFDIGSLPEKLDKQRKARSYWESLNQEQKIDYFFMMSK